MSWPKSENGETDQGLWAVQVWTSLHLKGLGSELMNNLIQGSPDFPMVWALACALTKGLMWLGSITSKF